MLGGIIRAFTGNPKSDYLEHVAREQARREAERKAKVDANAKKILGIKDQYDDGFYQGIAEKVMRFAKPKLDEQYGEGVRGLKQDLYSRGIVGSSIAGQKAARLQRGYNDAELDLESESQRQAEGVRGNIARSITDALNLNAQTGGSQVAYDKALADVSGADTIEYQPLEDLILRATDILGKQASLERKTAQSAFGETHPYNRYSLFGIDKKSDKVVRGY